MSDTECGRTPPHYRLPASTAPGSVRLQVRDLERSIEFYQRVLGCRTLEQRAGRASLGVTGEPPLIHLHEYPGAEPVPPHGRLGLYHFAILLPGRAHLGAFLRHVAALGLNVGMSDHHVSEALYLSDPDGLGIEVYCDRPRDQWSCVQGELHMTTEPLDSASLAAAASAPWDGMPAGTRLGHLHLFVADLRAAADFYHAALGLDQMVWSYPGALFLAAGGYHHHLGTNTWARNARPPAPQDARLLEWSLVLPGPDDVRAAAASLRTAGHDTTEHAGDCLVADPWGTRLRLTTA